MQSAAPSSEWDDDAITMLAEYAGWSVLQHGNAWQFYRLTEDGGAFDTAYAESKEEALNFLATS
jgi:hypothetical protein